MSQKDVDVDAIVQGGTLVVETLNSASNAYGSKSPSSWLELGSLVPKVFSFAAKAGEIPEELHQLDNKVASQIIDGLASKLDLANDHAEAVAKAVLRLFSTLLSYGGDALEGIVEAIKGPAEESPVGKDESASKDKPASDAPADISAENTDANVAGAAPKQPILPTDAPPAPGK